MSDEAIELQFEWLTALAGDGELHVAAPIRTLDGAGWTAIEIDGSPVAWRCVAVTWTPGVRRSPRPFVSPRVLSEVGATVGRMHLVAERFPWSPLAVRSIDADQLVGERSCLHHAAESLLDPRDLSSLRASAEVVASVLTSIDAGPDQFGIVHGDLEPSNWVFDRGRPSPIDFDEFGAGFYLFDLLNVLWSHAGWPNYLAYRDQLFAGYERVRALPEPLRRHADIFQAATFYAWLNHGCAHDEPASQQEFLAWVPHATKLVHRLCTAEYADIGIGGGPAPMTTKLPIGCRR